MSPYNSTFFEAVRGGARRSAERIIPLIIQQLRPRSVLDIGCGEGIWLAAFLKNGVEDVLGVDGAYIPLSDLEIPACRFVAADLTEELDVGRRFDLVISLEVAEHLPVSCAQRFVYSLVRHLSCIVFSAAIPYHGGKCHINEQWPSYWARLFAEHGFHPWDALRPKLWNNDGIEYWYSQNMLILIKEGDESRFPSLRGTHKLSGVQELNVVHPRQYLRTIHVKESAEKTLWHCRVELVKVDIENYVPLGATTILADDGTLPLEMLNCREIVRLREVDGVSLGPPADDWSGIDEVRRLRKSGANYLVLAWPAFWWETRFAWFDAYLRDEATCLVRSDRCRIYTFGRK